MAAAKLKLALVGCGAIARFHLDGIVERNLPIEVTAAVDTYPDKAQGFASETGAEVFTDFDTALEKGDFDAVDLMLPHDLHEPFALATFAAGKHLLLEKPMAPTLAGCNRILAAARESGQVFMVAENAQYWPEIVRARELIETGAIGEIITARAAFVMEFDKRWFPDGNAWRFEAERTGGGITIDGGSHWIRPLRMWMGEIDEVVGVTDRPFTAMQGESLVHALLRFRSGKVATFDALMADTTLGPENWWRVTGTQGEILVAGKMEGGIRLFDTGHPMGLEVQPPQGYAKSFGGELEDFCNAVLTGSPLCAGPEEALGELRTALAIYRSASSGRWEKVW
jgi:UDP-N-acetyl-2-amino-2-deoxyglucuronate dehydrogenase